MRIADSTELPVRHIAGAFRNVTNSYKFYWFLAILEHVKRGKTTIPVEDIIIEMMGEVWYPVTYFRLSFGKQDKFDDAIDAIRQSLGCEMDIAKDDLIALIRQNRRRDEIRKLINELSRYVPYRFLTPWFDSHLKGLKDQIKNPKIRELASGHFTEGELSLYRFTEDNRAIEISPAWLEYLRLHLEILSGYTFWRLVEYLQKHNPNVPNIPVKLFPPERRSLTDATKFWNMYRNARGGLYCPYSGKPVGDRQLVVDHFLPWRFVGHDQLWNLAPTLQEVNSSKSDRLPDPDYLEGFAELQFDAFHKIMEKKSPPKKLLEDYSILFNTTLQEIANMKQHQFREKLINTIRPQMQIAVNMGFSTGWRWDGLS